MRFPEGNGEWEREKRAGVLSRLWSQAAGSAFSNAAWQCQLFLSLLSVVSLSVSLSLLWCMSISLSPQHFAADTGSWGSVIQLPHSLSHTHTHCELFQLVLPGTWSALAVRRALTNTPTQIRILIRQCFFFFFSPWEEMQTGVSSLFVNREMEGSSMYHIDYQLGIWRWENFPTS